MPATVPCLASLANRGVHPPGSSAALSGHSKHLRLGLLVKGFHLLLFQQAELDAELVLT
jgi:hypothetical protein